MKKICYITTVSITLKTFVLPVAEYLHKHTDWEITFICNEDEAFAKILPDYIRYIPVPMERGISLGGIAAMLKMVKIFREEKFDLVQYSTPNASLYASLAAFIARVPVRLYCQWGMAFVGFHGIKRAIFKTVEHAVCRLSTWIEPDSRGNLNFSHKEGLYPAHKGSVIWNGSASGVNLAKFDIVHKEGWKKQIREQYKIPEDAFVYCFIGRITGDKGINELFSAFQTLLQKDPSVYLLLVGNMEKTASVDDALFAWAQNEPHVVFCGYTTVVEQFLAASDVYVLPSYREGFGSAVIEAEAMGLPVIVTDIPGPTDAMIADKTGLIAKKADTKTLIDAMDTMRINHDLRTQMGVNAFQFAKENFEQQKLFAEILKDRKRLLGE